MTKSSMRSAGQRRANQRIQRATVDRREQLQAQAYQSRKERQERQRAPEVVAAVRWYRSITRRVRTFLGRLFRGGASRSIRSLDLTTGQGRHALHGTKRDAGAEWLRNNLRLPRRGTRRRIRVGRGRYIWKTNQMISTRDGRPV